MQYLQEGHRILESLMVWSVKTCKEGLVSRFKCRVCARGDTRQVGIHHASAEVYANILKLKSLRILFSVALQDMSTISTDHWDIICAFLAGLLNKLIFMRLPQGFPGVKSRIVKLLRSIYGLPEALRVFSDKLTKALLKLGFTQSTHVLRRKSSWIIIPAWVDDMFPTYNDVDLKNEIYAALNKEFIMKDMGPLVFSLGIHFQIDYKLGVIKMDQSLLKREILESVGMTNCNPLRTPLPNKISLPKQDGSDAESKRIILGQVLYLVQGTCPHLAHASSLLSSRVSFWSEEADRGFRHLMRFLAGDLDQKLIYSRSTIEAPCSLVTFFDADLAGELPHSPFSRSGYLCFVNGCLVSWCSKKQPMVATSSKDAEIMSAYVASTESFWIRGLLVDLDTPETGPSLLWTDSAAAKQQADGEIRHVTNKHLLTKFHWPLELVKNRIFEMRRLPSARNISDALTKSLVKYFSFFGALMLGYHVNDDMRGFPLNDAEAYYSAAVMAMHS